MRRNDAYSFFLTAGWLCCTVFPSRAAVWIEAESVTPATSEWVFDTQWAGFKGTGYLAYTGGSSRDQNVVVSYAFSVPADGRYWIQVRGRRDKDFQCPSGAADDQCNDFFSKVDGGAWEKTMMKRAQYGDDDGGSGGWGNWFWDGRLSARAETRPLYDLTAGQHTWSISGRSPGVKIDAIAIFLDGEQRPAPGGGGQPPTASFSFSPNPVFVGDSVGFDGSASTDPDGTIVEYRWNFNDGSPVQTGSSLDTLTYSFTAPGTYDVTLTVKDNDALSASRIIRITVNGVDSTPPVMTCDAVRLSGRVNDLSIQQIMVGSQNVAVVAGNFETDVLLSGSAVTVTVSAQDGSGQSAARQVRIVP